MCESKKTRYLEKKQGYHVEVKSKGVVYRAMIKSFGAVDSGR